MKGGGPQGSTIGILEYLSHSNNNADSVPKEDTGSSIDCVILQHPIIGSESPQILMINNSFSSQTWAILVPNRNFDQKSL